MSYQVLARKWRPRRFAELVGQEHVVRALTHALDSGRVHHAFLFTGTRGVGKTTIARIFAKSLNCERGVSADPCGECNACRDVDAGRFMDLLEIDAASNTGIDDVRELIENAQYLPARGKFKVYLIDEVHMLSKPAFNALLKTLEEPPEHAKFLLATTDPQKLPITVLSRCLQFNLKRLTQPQIAMQLLKILAAEGLQAEPEAVQDIAHAGNGSVRDALSLLDQAIAYGGGELRTAEVRAMLGTIDPGKVAGLLEAVAAGDAATMLALVEATAEYAPDFEQVLNSVAEALHRIQVAQFVPPGAGGGEGLAPSLQELAGRLHPEEVQLLYQIAITGARDLEHAPSPRAGFEMTLLRMLAFRPEKSGEERGVPVPAQAVEGKPAARNVAAAKVGTPALAVSASTDSAGPAPVAVPQSDAPAASSAPAVPPASAGTMNPPGPRIDATRWAELLEAAALRGPVRELAINSVMLEHAEGCLRLGLKPAHQQFRSEALTRQLAEALSAQLGAGLKIKFEAVAEGAVSLADCARQEQAQRHERAEAAIAADPFVQTMISQFDARVVPNTTRPRNLE